MSESDAELVRKVSDRLAHADELRRQLDKSIAECVALAARAEAAEARASRARREALEEAARVVDGMECDWSTMTGFHSSQIAAAIRALIDSEKGERG